MELADEDLFEALEGVEHAGALWEALAQSGSGSDGGGGGSGGGSGATVADGAVGVAADDALWGMALRWTPSSAAPPPSRRQPAQLRCVDATHAADCTRCAHTTRRFLR
jgi:hypothetical protein